MNLIFARTLADLRRAAFIAVAVMAVGAVAAPDFAAAQGLFGSDDPAPSARQRRRANAQRAREARPARREVAAKPDKPAKEIKIPKVAMVAGPPEPLVAVISLQSQRIQVHGAGGVLAESKVSTGTSGHRTPTGVFSVLQRNRYHESNIYSGAPMPFMQRVTWSGIAMHQGVVPGYPASHGCIRLPGEFASRMWGIGRLGMRVIIAPSDVIPETIAHARLPVPVMTAVAANAIPAPVQTAAVAGTSGDSEQRLLDPFKYAQTRKVKVVTDHVTAEKAIQPAFDLARDKSAEASRFAEELRKLEHNVAAAEQKVAQKRAAPQAEATPSPGTAAIVTASVAGPGTASGQGEAAKADTAATTPATTTPAAPASEHATALKAAEQELATAKSELAAARATEQAKSDAAFDAARAAREAEAAAATAADASKLANVATEPVTIFVSRKEGRVYVRQGFAPIHDEPIAFSEPDRALGTHVFTAMSAQDGGAALAWNVVSVPNTPPEIKAKEEKPRSKKGKAEVAEPKPQLPASSASGALDRFELPEATKKLVSDRIWPGASLIVSDYGISGETGRGTDFIVLTK